MDQTGYHMVIFGQHKQCQRFTGDGKMSFRKH